MFVKLLLCCRDVNDLIACSKEKAEEKSRAWPRFEKEMFKT